MGAKDGLPGRPPSRAEQVILARRYRPSIRRCFPGHQGWAVQRRRCGMSRTAARHGEARRRVGRLQRGWRPQPGRGRVKSALAACSTGQAGVHRGDRVLGRCAASRAGRCVAGYCSRVTLGASDASQVPARCLSRGACPSARLAGRSSLRCLLDRAVGLLALRDGDNACSIACGPGYNIARLVRAVGPRGLVTAVEDNPHLLSRAQRKVEQAGWGNVKLLASLDPGQLSRVPVEGIIIGYNPPIVLQRPDLLKAARAILKPGGAFLPSGRAAPRVPDGSRGPSSSSGSASWAIPVIGITGPCMSLGSTSQSSPGERCRSCPSWALSTSCGPRRRSTPKAPQQQTGGPPAEALTPGTPATP